MSPTDEGRQLAAAVDTARMDLGLSKLDLARLARVARSTIADLINQGKVPSRATTRRQIEAALGWTEGSFELTMAGHPPELRGDAAYPPSQTAQVLIEQLNHIHAEAAALASAADAMGHRFRQLAEATQAAAHLVSRHHR